MASVLTGLFAVFKLNGTSQFFSWYNVFHQRLFLSLSVFFMLFLHLQFSHCLNSLIPCESGRLHRLGSALFAPSTLISEHRSPHCDRLNPLRIIYQPLWCALPDIILWQCWEWLDFTRGTLPLWDQKKHLVYKQELYHVSL